MEETIKIITDYVAAGSFADIAKNVSYKNTIDYAQLIRTVDLKHDFKGDNQVYVDEVAFEYLWRVNLNEESIILPNIGVNIGEVYYTYGDKLPSERNVLGPNAILLRSEKNSNLLLFYLFHSESFQKQLKVIIASSGQPKFNKTELRQIKITVPEIKEQKLIGEFFKFVDETITLHQRMLLQKT